MTRSIDELKGDIEILQAALAREKINVAFAYSKYVAERLALPADLLAASFGQHFQVEDGNKIVAQDGAGNRIFSRVRPGDVATFDEALETLVAGHPNKNEILKGSPGSNGIGGNKTISRAQFEALSAAEQATTARTPGLVITD